MAKTKRLAGMKVLIEDLEYLKEMQKRMVMLDGNPRGLAVVLHQILSKARSMLGDSNLMKDWPE